MTLSAVKDRVLERFEIFWKGINYSEIMSPMVGLHFLGWIVSFIFIIVAIETNTNWKIVWMIFHGYFWYKLNKDILRIFNPPVEILLLLLLTFYSIEFTYIKTVFNSVLEANITNISRDPLGFLSFVLLAILMLLFGLILIINTKPNGVSANKEDKKNYKGIEFKQSVLFVYIVIGYLAHLLIFFEHIYYLYLLQFFLFLVLLGRTVWLEKLSKNELWIYFVIFLFIYYLFTDPSSFQKMKVITANQKTTWISLPYYLHFLIKTYFLVLLVKIPIVLIYNHAGLERKLWIAGLFQSTFPQFIQFAFLIAIFFFFISGWQSDKLREVLTNQRDQITQGNIPQGTSHATTSLNQFSSTINIPKYHPTPLPTKLPKVGVIELELAQSDYGKKDYFLYYGIERNSERMLHLIKIDTIFTTWITSRLSILAGSGLIVYPYSPKTWQDFFYDRDFLQSESDIRIYPFDITSENQTWSLVTTIDKPDASSNNIVFRSRQDIFANQKFVIGRVFLPIINSVNIDQKYFAIDIFHGMEVSLSNSAMSRIVLVLVVLFLLLNIFVIRRVGKFGAQINKIIVQKFALLKKGIREISSGNLDYKFKMEGEDEFVELAGHFNQMGDKLKKTIAEVRDKDRLDHELKIARQVQINLLPTKLPEIEGYQVAASLKTANEVGGDLYDIIQLDKNKYLFTIGDVSGKGSSAAFYMAQFISLLRFSPQFTHKPLEIALRLNEYFSTKIVDRQIFITAIIGILDISTDTITFVRAGHTPPLMIPGEDKEGIEEVNTGGLGIGLTKAQGKFKNALRPGKVKIKPGDKLVFYTDGVVEAAIPSKTERDEFEVFGDDRFCELLLKFRGANAHEILVAVSSALNTFYADNPSVDDYTIFVIQKSV